MHYSLQYRNYRIGWNLMRTFPKIVPKIRFAKPPYFFSFFFLHWWCKDMTSPEEDVFTFCLSQKKYSLEGHAWRTLGRVVYRMTVDLLFFPTTNTACMRRATQAAASSPCVYHPHNQSTTLPTPTFPRSAGDCNKRIFTSTPKLAGFFLNVASISSQPTQPLVTMKLALGRSWTCKPNSIQTEGQDFDWSPAPSLPCQKYQHSYSTSALTHPDAGGVAAK